jgi:protein SEY1
LDDEMLLLPDARQQAVTTRFRKAADAVYVEAKRGALGGVRETPLWMWALLLVLGQNEIIAVARSPLLLVFAILAVTGLYVTYQLNLWEPILRMSGAAWSQGVAVGKERLREFLLSSEAGRQALAMEGRREAPAPRREQEPKEEGVRLEKLNSDGKKVGPGSGVWSDDEE